MNGLGVGLSHLRCLEKCLILGVSLEKRPFFKDTGVDVQFVKGVLKRPFST